MSTGITPKRASVRGHREVVADVTAPMFPDRSLSSHVARLAREEFGREEFAREGPSVVLVFLFDHIRRLIAFAEVLRDPVDQPLVLVRDVFRVALVHGASAVAFAHNHAIGDIAPSASDHEATRVAWHAGEVLGVPLLDHVIVASGSDEYISFRQMGWLPSAAPRPSTVRCF